MRKRYKRMLNNHRRAIKANMKLLKEMIKRQNPYAYGASLNNILDKVRHEIGVERVAITLLNDVLSYLGKWPELSAEDTPRFSRTMLQTIYGLTASSVPDGMILDDSVTYQQAKSSKEYICPYVLIEVKDLSVDPTGVEYTGSGADAVFQELLKLGSNPNVKQQIIKDILTKGAGPNGNHMLPNGWNIEVKEGPLTITASSGIQIVATLYQLDIYLLALYAYDNIKHVIWTNGLVWKIFSIDNGTLKDRKFNLDKNGYGYIPDGYTGNIQIDRNEFNALINYLRSILSTL